MVEDLNQAIRAAAREIGFDLVGVTAPDIEEATQRAYRDWLKRTYQGSMAYLARNAEKRLDPRRLVPSVKSIICLGVSYYQTVKSCGEDSGRVALYAWGRDYHRVIKEMLRRLEERIEALVGRKIVSRIFVDTGPVLEKPLAMQAGIGWIGKNTCLINREIGSFLFLGELFVDLDLQCDEPGKNHCGACRRCLESCPTHALIEPGVLDARRCISYLTIEHQGDIEPERAGKLNGWIFGCDICQRVCPFNRFAKPTAVADFRDHRLGPRVDPAEVLTWTDQDYRTRTADSAGARASLRQWQRNARLLSQPV